MRSPMERVGGIGEGIGKERWRRRRGWWTGFAASEDDDDCLLGSSDMFVLLSPFRFGLGLPWTCFSLCYLGCLVNVSWFWFRLGEIRASCAGSENESPFLTLATQTICSPFVSFAHTKRHTMSSLAGANIDPRLADLILMVLVPTNRFPLLTKQCPRGTAGNDVIPRALAARRVREAKFNLTSTNPYELSNSKPPARERKLCRPPAPPISQTQIQSKHKATPKPASQGQILQNSTSKRKRASP